MHKVALFLQSLLNSFHDIQQGTATLNGAIESGINAAHAAQ